MNATATLADPVPADSTTLKATTRALLPELRAHASTIESARRVPDGIVEQLRDLRLFALQTPAELGGLELDPLDTVEIVETLAQGDASVAWCVMIGAGTNALAARLPEQAARELFTRADGHDVISGGSFHPRGEVVAVDGGYRLTGRWAFASGSQHADWLCGGAIVPTQSGAEHRLLFVPACSVTIVDTWHVSGLRGTGSHDFEVDSVFVPRDHTMTLNDVGWARTPLSRIPGFTGLLPVMAAVTLGVARAAIDEFVTIALDKTPYRSSRLLYERETVQSDIAKAEASLRSARAFLVDAFSDNWSSVCAGQELSTEQRALGRLAAVHAAHASASVVDTCYELAGGSSIYDHHVLQRHFRDVHTATQHVALASSGFETVGRVLFGLEPDTTLL